MLIRCLLGFEGFFVSKAAEPSGLIECGAGTPHTRAAANSGLADWAIVCGTEAPHTRAAVSSGLTDWAM